MTNITTTYEKLLIEADEANILVRERELQHGFKGLYKNNKVIIDKKIDTNCEKACVLSEELGHHYTSFGKIVNTTDIKCAKQESIARGWGYRRLVGFTQLIESYRKRIKINELPEFLGVTEQYLCEALNYYEAKHGPYHEVDNYTICFNPFGVYEDFRYYNREDFL